MLRFIVSLQAHESMINDLNVFPVPDGDTGTNSLLSVLDLLKPQGWPTHSLHSATQFVALSIADQARGNSGVILAEYFRGLAEALEATATSQQWHRALTQANIMARACVAQPQEGTILTVARDVAQVVPQELLADYLSEVSKQGRVAVQESTDLLPALQAAGVVDAGALVLSLFHDAMFEQVSGTEMPDLTIATPPCILDSIEYSGPSHEVMFLIDVNESPSHLREELTHFGESLVIAGSANPYHVHIHCNQPTELLSHISTLGHTYRVSVTSLLDKKQSQFPSHTLADCTRAVVLCQGPAMRSFLREQGVFPVEVMPRTKPSTRDIREAILLTGAQRVVVFPSDVDSLATAHLASRETRALGLEVEVIPTASIVQSLAGVSVIDPDVTVEEQRDHLEHVVESVFFGSVTVAQRDAVTPAGTCTRGDYLGLVQGIVVTVTKTGSADDVGHRVIQELLKANPRTEIITVVVGSDGDTHFCDVVQASYPDIEVVVIPGGQMFWPYIIGVE